MALTRRSQRVNSTIWPGFVDAMTGLLLVLMFVLTIFMVIQFVLRETIAGQSSRLDELANEVAALAGALGLEQNRAAELSADIDRQAVLIATLTQERDQTAAALADAQGRITSFESQVAGLLAQQAQAQTRIDDLQDRETALMSEQQALELALATAREEIDAEAEAARLAAAQREALEAMIADLQTNSAADAERISTLEAEQLANAAAVQALRDRLANADTELTAMTLALEEKRREAEETLTLLAATQSARDQLDMNLAAALLAQQQAENDLARALTEGSDLDARLLAAIGLADSTAAELAAARAELGAANEAKQDLTLRLAAAVSANAATAGDLQAAQAALEQALANSARTEADLQGQLAAALLAQEAAKAEAENAAQAGADLESRLAEALLARQALEAEVESLSEGQSETAQERADLQSRLAAALAQSQDAQDRADQQTDLLAVANQALSQEESISAEAQRQVALLNAQVAELRSQVGSLQAVLDAASAADAQANVQIEQLGAQLNTALARVAAEERRRRALEEAERTRLEQERARLAAEAQNLERFRSNFFGELRKVLEGKDGVQIVGDRFVFSSEVLFATGEAELSPQGRAEISNVAEILRQIADEIPPGIDWVIRVDGHTDNLPLSGTGRYRDNWELSQARALSVVRYMQDALGIAPERLAANGFGEFQPINTADTDAARAQNRRIELKLTER